VAKGWSSSTPAALPQRRPECYRRLPGTFLSAPRPARPRRQLTSSTEQQKAGDALLSACRQQLQRQEALAAELSQQLQLTQDELLAKLQVERNTAARQIAELQQVGSWVGDGGACCRTTQHRL
jgi:hypothetical protein